MILYILFFLLGAVVGWFVVCLKIDKGYSSLYKKIKLLEHENSDLKKGVINARNK